MIESDIEKTVCDYARKLGYFVFKLTFISFTGAPDRLFLKEGGVIIFAEFKRPKATPRKRQHFVHQILKQCGFPIYVLDNKAKAIEILDFHASKVPKEINKRWSRK